MDASKVVGEAAIAALSICVTTVVKADQLQFKIQATDGTSYAAFAQVHLLNDQNAERFVGYADRYGRIEANVAPGSYRAVLVVRGAQKMTQVHLTGTHRLTVVTLN